ncbi:MAG: T9SS type A sorting domain-containing protein [Bacteroidota bacterium]
MLKNFTLKIQSSSYKLLFCIALTACFTGAFEQAKSQDIGITAIVSPVSPKCSATNQSVVIRIKNFDTDTIHFDVDTVILTVNISGASTQTFTDTLMVGDLAPDSLQNLVVTQLANFSATGTHMLETYITLLSDVNHLNDTINNVSVSVNPTPATPTIMAYGTTTFCDGDSVLLVSNVSSGILWSDNTTTNDSLVVYDSDSYTVTVTNGGCSATSAVTMVMAHAYPTAPIITAHGPTTFCTGDSVILVSNDATGIMWSDNSTNDSLTVWTAGPYAVTATDNGCSSTSDTTTVVVKLIPATPTITTSDTTLLCTGESVTLFSSSLTGNTWSSGPATNSINVSTAGPYTVTVTVNGCAATSAPTTITVKPLPIVALTAFTTTPCTTDAPFALTGGSPAGGTYSGIGVDSLGMFHPESAGALQGITYTVTDTNGCSNSASRNMAVQYCAGIEELSLEGISIYPNPSTGNFNIVVKNANFRELVICITDIQGKEIFSSSDKNISSDYNKQINLTQFAKGIYYVKLSSSADVKIKKLIIE